MFCLYHCKAKIHSVLGAISANDKLCCSVFRKMIELQKSSTRISHGKGYRPERIKVKVFASEIQLQEKGHQLKQGAEQTDY